MRSWLHIIVCVLALVGGSVDAVASVDDVRALVENFEKSDQNNSYIAANKLLETLHHEDEAYAVMNFTGKSDYNLIKREVYFNACDYLYCNNDFERAIACGLKALPLCRGTETEADCLNLLAMSYFRLSDYNRAADYAKQCYALDEQTGDPDVMSSSLNTIAGIYLGANQPKEAEKYILKAIAMAEKANNAARQAVLHGTASEIYHAMLDDDKALTHINRACEIEEKLGRQDKLMVRYTQKASVLNGLHRYADAEQVLLTAIPALQQMGDEHSLGIACNKMGMALFSQHREAEAVPYFRRAADIFVKMGDLGNELHSRRGLYESLWHSNPDSAKIELDRFDLLKDSLYSHANAESLARFNAELENDWLQQENIAQRARTRNIIIWGVLIAVLIATAIWWWMRRRSRMREAALQAIIDELSQATGNAASPSQDELPVADRDFLAQIVDYVKNNIENNVSVEMLADKMCITRGHLNRKVKAITGITTQQYITRIRLEHARMLLEQNPDMNITQVAMQCGFDDASSFTRAFKRTFGATPSQHRSANN